MKFSAVLAIAAATGYVSAQDLSALPSCSLSCLLTGVTATGCSSSDFKCSCGKSAQLSSSVTPCIQKACSASDQQKTVTQLESICQSAGVPISLSVPGASSPASSPASTPASTPAASPASSPASSASSPASSAAAGYGSSASHVASSAASVASSAASVASSAAGSSVTAGPSASAGSASNGTATSVYTGGAAAATGLPIALAALAGALYVL